MFSRWKVLPTQSYRNAQLAYKGNWSEWNRRGQEDCR
jgi:hypothetical protein